MPRMARVIVADIPHHVVQRGHNRKVVFVEPRDFEYYLSTLQVWKKAYGVKVYSYCLMTNHVHLILNPGKEPESISVLMKRLAGRQTRFVNKLEGRTGSLWDGRYKISPIATDEYLLQCCRYVDLNPAKAHMVAEAQDYLWSSYASKIGMKPMGFLDLDECYLALSDPEVDYKRFVEEGISEGEQRFIQQSLERNQLTGSNRFVDEIEARTGFRIEHRKPGRPRKGEEK